MFSLLFKKPFYFSLYCSNLNRRHIDVKMAQRISTVARRFMKNVNSAAVALRQRLQESGFTSTRFHDFETASKSMRFGRVYTKLFSPEN